jgi:hypothetical protein
MFGSIPAWEMFVLVLVVLATLSLATPESESNEQTLEVAEITGEMRLTSRASMDALGLQDFQIGPLAIIALDVRPIQSQGCTECQSIPTGFHINGEVTITELVDSAGRNGRVEGTLNITYLRESTDTHTLREWFNVDWNAGPASSHWVGMLHHTPAKWTPSEAFSSTFLETSQGFESRTGPFVSFHSLGETSREIEGCLPGGFSCSKASQNDYTMIANFTELRTPSLMSHPEHWHKSSSNQSALDQPEGMDSIRSILSLDDTVASSEVWSPDLNETPTAMQTWSINTSNSPNFAPMAPFFQALGLPSISYHVPDGTWTEADFSKYSTGVITNEQGELVLSLIRLDA